jgi:hypothetical protein
VEERADRSLDRLGVEHADRAVADDEGVDGARAGRPHDRSEIAGALDPLGSHEERVPAELEAREVGRPAADDGEQPVGTLAAGDRAERVRCYLDDLGSPTPGLRGERGLEGAEVQVGS